MMTVRVTTVSAAAPEAGDEEDAGSDNDHPEREAA